MIIDFLLASLKDEDNVVRWTAAKGIGRITMRLNEDFADQIV
jgi:HEAT repeat protein